MRVTYKREFCSTCRDSRDNCCHLSFFLQQVDEEKKKKLYKRNGMGDLWIYWRIWIMMMKIAYWQKQGDIREEAEISRERENKKSWF